MWSIQVLGGLSVTSPQRQLTRFRTQKAASLLAYLACHSAPQPRETLIDLFWPEAESEVGRHNLSNALSFLRHQLEPPGTPPGTIILADRASVRLNPAAVSVDAVEFERDLHQANAKALSDAQRLSHLQRGLERYQGALLPGFYEEWIAAEAARLESLFVQAVNQLVPALLAAGKPEQALAYAQRAVSADPLSEEATRCVIKASIACGQSSGALRAYQALEQRLSEMGITPSQDFQRHVTQLEHIGASQIASALSDDRPSDSEAFALAGASQNLAMPTEPSLDIAVVRFVPPARLLGEEFLLRTTTRFFGREEEIAHLGRLFSTPRIRLVTVTGPGGTGKTRLALEVAAHLVERAVDNPPIDTLTSAVFVPLGSFAETDRLFDVMLRSLGVIPIPTRDPLDQLASVLTAHPNTLLVLDNFEHLVEEGALDIRDLLARVASIKLLITSRQRLQIESEREFRLAPLPTSGGVQFLEEMQQVPSIALFVDRAQMALSDFQLTERNASAVAQLCDYLEGLPLAIELAAARVALLSPARILEQVQKTGRLDFLATRRRNAESRQKTLRATLDWSYQLLGEPAQTFLAALSVFRGGWTLEAAQAVCALNEEETLELLTLLRDNSLIGVEDTEAGLRFTLLETIREYSQEKLTERGEETVVRCRHRDYFAALAEQAEQELLGPDQVTWLDRLQTEHDNLCAAMERSETEETGEQTSLWLVGALSRFWLMHGYFDLGRDYLTRVLNRADASQPTAARAKALHGAASLALRQGDHQSARTLFEESLEIKRQAGDRVGIAATLNNMGEMSREQGDFATARRLLEECIAIKRELGNIRSLASSLHNLGMVAADQGDYASAVALHEESLAIKKTYGDKRGIAGSLLDLGGIAFDVGDFGGAKTRYEQSLTLAREIGHNVVIATALNNLAMIAREQADYGTARTLYEECLTINQEMGYKRGIANTLVCIGVVANDQGDYREAKSWYVQSLAIAQEIGDRLGIAEALECFGNLALSQGLPERAVRLWGAEEAFREEIGAPWPPVEQERRDRRVFTAREALGNAMFAVAWEQGRAMPLEQAVAYLREERTIPIREAHI